MGDPGLDMDGWQVTGMDVLGRRGPRANWQGWVPGSERLSGVLAGNPSSLDWG